MPATATIAPIRATEFLVFFMPERRAAVAPITSGDVDESLVNEFHGSAPGLEKHKRPAGRAFSI
jgi:hypothetical protein